MKEVWDAYDKNFNKLNVELTRGDTLKEGYYHLVTEIIVKHIDGTYLLMQRDYNKNLGGKVGTYCWRFSIKRRITNRMC
ncbi:hypothetical protein [Streptococcus uberis]|uniref:hypothetical protein n=1 Tax=Streptococcus uberis TaxID=1349 RepID=UPI001FF43D37|nr:hypothetical protein [Streptococcus uberis]MCK1169632.1 hypothetical protein [Streptococcus uberis]MCK1187896.1 hypothetical protein [Streptococcus uberis]MCK1243145.1 hypothetical protein [Streptococcus uberis]MCK1259220.1 hypothetical protein [Streptococcus uberis]